MSEPDDEYELKAFERKLLDEMFAAFDGLRRQGWSEANYAPIGPDLWLIEAGSTGVHRGRRNQDHSFWVADDCEIYPSNPILFRRVSQ